MCRAVKPGWKRRVTGNADRSWQIASEQSKGARKQTAPSHISRLKLMMAAEKLVAEHGLHGVSARAIAKAAKLKNNCSVQYHFGSLENLFEQLLRYRMGELELYRQEMLDALDSDSRAALSPRQFVEIICLPHLRLRDRKGEFPYANFLSQYLPQQFPGGFRWIMRHGPGSPAVISSLIADYRKTVPGMPDELLDLRLASATLLFLNTIRGLPAMKWLSVSEPEIIEDALCQSVAALTAPISG